MANVGINPTADMSRIQDDPTRIFKVEASQLEQLFATPMPPKEEHEDDQKYQRKLLEKRRGMLADRLKVLYQLHGQKRDGTPKGIDGLLEKLQTDRTSGIMGDKADLQRREGNFRKNEKPARAPTPFWDSFKQGIAIPAFYALAGCAALSMITGMIYDPKTGWVEGVSIVVVLALMVLIGSFNDWIQDSRFAELQSRASEQSLPVFRGKHAEMQTVSMWKLVVGDVVLLSPGDLVPADCIVIRSDRLKVIDEGALEHESTPNEKGDNDPFLFVDDQIVHGTCTAVVVCVGTHSTRKFELGTLDLGKTELQKKTKNLASTFNLITFISAAVILLLAVLIQIIQTATSKDFEGKIFVKKFMQNITLALVLIIVCMPEGLPVTVDLSLAHSTKHMDTQENILVRNLDAPEIMGKITEICTGLTGTLTESEFSVGRLFAQQRMIKNSRRDTLTHCQLTDPVVDLIIESIMWNSDCHMELTPESMYAPKGNDTECAFLKWLQDAEVVHRHCITRQQNECARIPFDSVVKRSIVAVHHPYLVDTVRVYIKGAPEVVLANCTAEFSDSGDKQPVDEDRIQEIKNKIKEKMSQNSQRAIAFSYKDMSNEDFENLRSATDDFNKNDTADQFATDQTLIAVISLKQPIRNDVKEALERARRGQVNVRIVTNNAPDTAIAQGLACGLIRPSKDSSQKRTDVMLGQEFSDACGGIEGYFVNDPTDEGNHDDPEYRPKQIQKFRPKDQNMFNQLIENVKIVARATPNDKLLIISGLANQDKAVGVIGDGNSDIKAFKAASVSLCMGSGTTMAQRQADIVLRDDDFYDSIRAIMFGRNIYSNIKRFLQFQVTCMFSLIVTMFIGYCYFTEAPINSTQLLWINLVMDTFAAIALATMPPLETVLSEPVTSQDTQVMTKAVWRQIYGVTLWNTVVMCIMIFAGKHMFGLTYTNATQTTERVNGQLTDAAIAKRTHLTIIFNTFVQLCWFNEWNCRVIRPNDYNPFTEMFLFRKPFSGWVFVFVMAVTAIFQWCSINFSMMRWLFESQDLSAQNYFRSVAWGASVIPIAFLLKLTPESWMNKIPVGINENKAFENRYLSMGIDGMKGTSGGSKVKPGSASQKSAKQSDEAVEPANDLNNDDNFQRA